MTELEPRSKSSPLSKTVMTEHRHTESLWVWTHIRDIVVFVNLPQREPKQQGSLRGLNDTQ